MRIRMLQTITGTFHNIDGGVARGQVVDVDDASARRYLASGLAEQLPTQESAVLATEGESAVVAPRRGRSRKQPEWHDENAPGWSEGNPQP